MSDADEVEHAKNNAQTQLVAALQEYETTIKRLETVRGDLAQAEASLRAKRHLLDDQRARALRVLDREIAAKQAETVAKDREAKALDVEINKLRQHRDDVKREIESFARKFAV
jgi:predicted RNase H-like nuclease (RuvC/YqgF family)